MSVRDWRSPTGTRAMIGRCKCISVSPELLVAEQDGYNWQDLQCDDGHLEIERWCIKRLGDDGPTSFNIHSEKAADSVVLVIPSLHRLHALAATSANTPPGRNARALSSFGCHF